MNFDSSVNTDTVDPDGSTITMGTDNRFTGPTAADDATSALATALNDALSKLGIDGEYEVTSAGTSLKIAARAGSSADGTSGSITSTTYSDAAVGAAGAVSPRNNNCR